MNTETLDRIRADLNDLIDADNIIENTTPHASPEWKAAQYRGNYYRVALKALAEITT